MTFMWVSIFITKTGNTWKYLIDTTACPKKIWPLDMFEHNSLENKYFTLSFGWDIDDQHRRDQTKCGPILIITGKVIDVVGTNVKVQFFDLCWLFGNGIWIILYSTYN